MFTEKRTNLLKTFPVILSAFILAIVIAGLNSVPVLAKTGPVTYEKDTRQDLVDFVRGAMIDREETIVFSYDASTDPDFNYSTFLDGILADVEDHRNQTVLNSRGGDYLKWSVGGSGSIPISYSGSIYTYTYSPNYYTNKAQEDVLETQVNAALASLNLDGKSDYEKVYLIYDYICDHVVYDHDHLSNPDYKLQFTAYAALVNGTSVCQGYAALLYDMLIKAGIDNRIVTGDTDNDNVSDHAWNIVNIDNKYYNVDVTFDSERNQKDFFLLSNATFVAHHIHTRDAEYNSSQFNEWYPMSTQDNPFALTEGFNIVGIGPYLDWGMIDMMVFVEFTDDDLAASQPQMIFDLPSGQQVVAYSDTINTTYAGKTCRIYTARVAAKEMTDVVEGRIAASDKESVPFSYSIYEYSKSILYNNSYSDYQPFVKAMLNYGAYSQLYFGYKTNDLANKDKDLWTDYIDPVADDGDATIMSAIGTNTFVKPTNTIGGVTYYGSNLVCEASTTLRHYFTYDTSKDLNYYKTNFKFYIGEEDVTDSLCIRSGYLCIEQTGIGAKNLSTAYSVRVETGSPVEFISFNYRVLDYVYRVLDGYTGAKEGELKNLVRAVFYYNKEAAKLGTVN